MSDIFQKDSAREIREYLIPDFRHWPDQQSYWYGFHKVREPGVPNPENTGAGSQKYLGRLQTPTL
jgi:hypothetical protein